MDLRGGLQGIDFSMVFDLSVGICQAKGKRPRVLAAVHVPGDYASTCSRQKIKVMPAARTGPALRETIQPRSVTGRGDLRDRRRRAGKHRPIVELIRA